MLLAKQHSQYTSFISHNHSYFRRSSCDFYGPYFKFWAQNHNYKYKILPYLAAFIFPINPPLDLYLQYTSLYCTLRLITLSTQSL